ncbi:MAG: PEP-CTERM sorting domain-containing protein [Kiritimatiellae bacterium]|jgi:hypothetical protein|nr:PEP-CTERM sorting domain-containing protein [Kiritimatiellia bacterium]
MKTYICTLSVLALLASPSLQASIVSSSTSGSIPSLSPQISSTDLLQMDLDASIIAGFDPTSSYGPSSPNGGNLYNGSADGEEGNETHYFGEAYIDSSTESEWSVDFYMDISTNILGYDIEEIHSYSGWNSGLRSQDFTIEVSTVDSFDFTSLGRFTYPQSGDSGHVVSIKDDEGASLATGVDVIRFTHHSGSGDARGSYRELDILGAATVIPEPGTAALLVIAGLFVLSLHRNRSRRND